MLTRSVLALMFLGVCSMLITTPQGRASADASCQGRVLGCVVTAKAPSTKDRHATSSSSSKHSVRPTSQGSRKSKPSISLREMARRDCQQAGLPLAKCGAAVVIGTPRGSGGGASTAVTITPYQAAITAAAYLPLRPGKPTIGPPPSLNKWKMAAVGYPLWIWAEGNFDPAPVSRTVSGLSVSLDASLAKIVYDMGDGTKIVCGRGTPWQRGHAAGRPSPDCGHTYTKPSLPEGSYTITATTYWSVAWTAGGQSGTIPFTQSSTTTLPVGEVQTLVR